jgi:hypothetical protein
VTADLKVLEKIKKLLALSESQNEHESASALAKAQALMIEHDVTSMQIQLSEIGIGSVKSQLRGRAPTDWEAFLLRTVSDAFGCELAWYAGENGARGEYKIIGMQHRVQMAEYAAMTLGRRLMRAREDYVAALPFFLPDNLAENSANGFCKGWILAIRKKVTDLAIGPEEAKAREAFIAKNLGPAPKFAEAKKTESTQLGISEGWQAGEKESIYQPMTGSAAEQAKIGS